MSTDTAALLERAVINSDLSALSAAERTRYYARVCESLGINPLTQPFAYIKLNGKLTLYAQRNCTDQLRRIHGVSIKIASREKLGDVYVVNAQAQAKDGRTDESIGVVPIGNLKGESLANALMKAECVPVDYEILTRRGFRSPFDVDTGEIVLAMDPETGEAHWTPLEDVSIYENQTVKAYGNAYFAAEFTEGHRWATVTSDGIRGLKPFESIHSGTYLQLSAVAAVSDDGTIGLTEGEAACLGWIVTDGTIKKYKAKPYRASICQSKAENFESIEWATASIGGATRGITDNRERGWRDQHWWYLSAEQTRALFESCGFESLADLPSIAASLSPPARKAMLDAMMRADGDARNTFAKTKPEIMECFQVLHTLEGTLVGKITERTMPRSTRPIYVQRALNHKRVSRNYLEDLGSRATTVWCPTTVYGTWFARTPDGMVFCTGNTKAKRRVTLSICGLSWMDESEIETTPAVAVDVSDVHAPSNERPKPEASRHSAGQSVRSASRSAQMQQPASDKARHRFWTIAEWCTTGPGKNKQGSEQMAARARQIAEDPNLTHGMAFAARQKALQVLGVTIEQLDEHFNLGDDPEPPESAAEAEARMIDDWDPSDPSQVDPLILADIEREQAKKTAPAGGDPCLRGEHPECDDNGACVNCGEIISRAIGD